MKYTLGIQGLKNIVLNFLLFESFFKFCLNSIKSSSLRDSLFDDLYLLCLLHPSE